MFIVQIPHGLSRTGCSYLSLRAEEAEELVMRDGSKCTVPAHESTAVLEIEEATKFETEDEAQQALESLFEITKDSDFELVDNFGSVLPYDHALLQYDRLLSPNGCFHNLGRNAPSTLALTSLNQVVVLIDVQDTLVSIPGMPYADFDKLMDTTVEKIKSINQLNFAFDDLKVALSMRVPEDVSLDEKRHRLQEELAVVFNILLKHMVSGALGPFMAEECVIMSDGEDAVPALDILTKPLETLVSIAEWYMDADKPFLSADLTLFNVQKTVINLIGYVQDYRTSQVIDVLQPMEFFLTAGDQRVLDVAEHILELMGISRESYIRATGMSQIYGIADVFISARGIQFQNGALSPAHISSFTRWNATGTVVSDIA